MDLEAYSSTELDQWFEESVVGLKLELEIWNPLVIRGSRSGDNSQQEYRVKIGLKTEKTLQGMNTLTCGKPNA